jgi:tetratricopeptide (TPR) repeat protein
MPIIAFPITLLALLLLVNLGCTEQPSTAGSDTTQAANPIRDLTRQLEFSPDDAQLYGDRSEAYYEAGLLDSAFQDLYTAIRWDTLGQLHQFRHQMGFYYYSQGRDDSAEHYYRVAIKMGTQNPETYYQLGNVFVLRGQYAEAIQLYNEALTREADEPTYYFAKGFAFRRLGEDLKAMDLLESSLRKDPKFIKSLNELFEIYFYDRQDEVAASRYNNRILEADSANPLGQFNLGELYYRRAMQEQREGQKVIYLKTAQASYENALRLDPNFQPAVYGRGYMYFELKQFAKAMSDFERAAQLAPRDYRPHFQIGSIYELYEDWEKARAAYRRALELNPSMLEAQQALSELNGR